MAVGGFTPEALARSAGADPWGLAQLVLTGRPDRVRTVGEQLHRHAAEAGEVARLGRVADAGAAAGFTNEEVPVYDVAQARQRSRRALGGDGELLTRAATTWTAMADDLGEARRMAGRHLEDLTVAVNRVIAARNAFMAGPGRRMPPEDVASADRGFVADADALVVEAAARIRGVVDGYDQQLRGHSSALATLAGEVGPVPRSPPDLTIAAQMGGPVEPPGEEEPDGLFEQLGKTVDGLLASEVRAVGGIVGGLDAIGDSIEKTVTGGINDLGNAIGGPVGDALVGAAGGLDDLHKGADDVATGIYGAIGDAVGGATGQAYHDVSRGFGDNEYDPEFDFDGTEFSRDEVEQFINGHTDDRNPTADRPTEHAVTETLDHGTRTALLNGTIQYDYTVGGRKMRIYVNPETPVRSTAFYLKKNE